MDFSIEELSIIALLLDEDEKKEKRRHWVHPIWKFRDTEGEFATLYRGLVDHEFKFYEYFRMSQNAFCDLLTKVEKYKKKDTCWRRAIFARERLAVCLRQVFVIYK
ncbi:unnamed protein product [Macrosiphum euphorbiae]|uniref:Protein ALP1-like n=1 Tax=Macrosiphum euphorbiae TaxID=13131 RepID=A0AAV0WB07_9HEMI|nr:unnamed protein product [Macrosiphum euphorbiae]